MSFIDTSHLKNFLILWEVIYLNYLLAKNLKDEKGPHDEKRLEELKTNL